MPSTRSTPIPSPRTSVIEDYLKVIYGHTEWQADPVTPSQLAARLGLAPSSVTEMVAKLAAQGLVEHAPYGAIALTATGRTEALRMVRRHRLIETWLVRQFGYSWDEVHDEAEVLEHAVSDRLLEEMDAQLGRPERDPHGDPIPRSDGTVPAIEGRLLAELGADEEARVVRISDRDPDVLRVLERAGVGVGAPVRRSGVPAEAAASIWVAPAES